MGSPPGFVDPLIGRRLAGCRIVERLGEGGMAVVYACRREPGDERVVAKVLHGEYVRVEEFVRRFQREAEAASRLVHPNVVRVLGAGQEGDLHYLMMEFVEGTTLERRIEEGGALPIDEAIPIAAQVARGLAAAHRAGIVHRDVKPGNVMLAPDGTAKIVDFGLARPIVRRSDETKITRTDYVLGTPEYMSPEQFDGREVDARSDVYSLGMTLYAMLAGRHPFEEGRGVTALMLRRLHEKPPPLEEAVPGVGPELSRLVGRMLSPAPRGRPADGERLARDLEAILAPAAAREDRPRGALARIAAALRSIRGRS